jgi:hypothetical protein
MMYLSTSLHGRKKKPLFMLFIGEGSAGKTTLAELHSNAIGMIDGKNYGFGYANKLETSFFTSQKQGGSGPDSQKMTIKKARYCYAEETNPGDALYMSRIKEYTGGGHITGNDKNVKQETFMPSCVWLFISNYKPIIKGSDYAAWRRLLLVNFIRRFMPPAKYDSTNPLHYPMDSKWSEDAPKDKHYLAAYLSILVHMHETLQTKYGGNITRVPCTRITKDTEAYQNEQDIYSRFIKERAIHIGKTYPGTNKKPDKVTLDEITKKFRTWFTNNVDPNPPHSQDIHHHINETILSKYKVNYSNDWIIEEWVILNPGDIFNMDEVVEKIKREESKSSEFSGLDTPEAPDTQDAPDVPDVPDDLPDDLPDVPSTQDNIIHDDLDWEDNLAEQAEQAEQAEEKIEDEFIDDLDD